MANPRAAKGEAVPPHSYAAFFRGTLGDAVIGDLIARFYDRESFVADNMYQTSYNEGQRAVIRFILGRIMQGELPPEPESGEDND